MQGATDVILDFSIAENDVLVFIDTIFNDGFPSPVGGTLFGQNLFGVQLNPEAVELDLVDSSGNMVADGTMDIALLFDTDGDLTTIDNGGAIILEGVDFASLGTNQNDFVNDLLASGNIVLF